MTAPELSRTIKIRQIRNEAETIEANASERLALAQRFGVAAIDSLTAKIALDPDGPRIAAKGSLNARITQTCAISGEDFPVAIDETIELVFVPAKPAIASVGEEIEIELEREELDEIEYEGDSFDLGEAVAQSLALAIDPYAEGPEADATRKKAGLTSDDAPSGPLAEALAALKKG
ncbi:YceD family protein [Parerythrobacter jejuensis]|uniref:DUF177 domain-containing protein n=1 Tax=Parerythrobacter jejuensis TaxID=795812 RepID=A0A845AXY4_9SPHN|nr:DUF177 domain-containing protein [Parerythrobacter jejuensis]MXP31377.1 DUF177 domain-containing protein [Parerythrobacter jejuensis]MXP34137.1 DUF177 domain-containing protein [Parerythrobacter jejuensis]